MTNCCDQVYRCPSSGETECFIHGGFDICCGHAKCPGGEKAYYARRREAQLERLTHGGDSALQR